MAALPAQDEQDNQESIVEELCTVLRIVLIETSSLKIGEGILQNSAPSINTTITIGSSNKNDSSIFGSECGDDIQNEMKINDNNDNNSDNNSKHMRDRKMEVEIPTTVFDNYNELGLSQTRKVLIDITKDTTFNQLTDSIKKNIKEITFENKNCYQIDKFYYPRSECIFNEKAWKSFAKNHNNNNNNNTNEDASIMSIYCINKTETEKFENILFKGIKWVTSSNDNINTYSARFSINKQFKFHVLTIFNKMANKNDNSDNDSKDEFKNGNDNNNNNEKKNDNDNNNNTHCKPNCVASDTMSAYAKGNVDSFNINNRKNNNNNNNNNNNSDKCDNYNNDCVAKFTQNFRESINKKSKLLKLMWRANRLNKISSNELKQRLMAMYRIYLLENANISLNDENAIKTFDNKMKASKIYDNVSKNVDLLMNHQRHKDLGYPLNESEMLSLYFLVNEPKMFDNMNNVLSNEISLSNLVTLQKYIAFDFHLFKAITKLNKFNDLKKIDKKTMKLRPYFALMKQEKELIAYSVCDTCIINDNVSDDSDDSVSDMSNITISRKLVFADLTWIDKSKSDNKIICVRRNCTLQ